MKYLLIHHAQTDEERLVDVFLSEQRREIATIEAIYGQYPAPPENESEARNQLRLLKVDGILRFEGNPALEWLNVAEVREL